MSASAAAARPRPRGMELPGWAVILILALFVGLSVWGVYKFWTKGPSSGVEYEELAEGTHHRSLEATGAYSHGAGPRNGGPRNRDRGNGGGAIPQFIQRLENRRDETLYKNGGGHVHVNYGNVEAVMTLPKDKDSKGTLDRIDYSQDLRSSWLTPDQYKMHVEGIRITANNVAQFVGLTREQRQQLRQLDYNLEITPAERTQLIDGAVAWDAATGPTKIKEGEKLKALVSQIGQAHLPETKAKLLKRVAEIPVIITAEQLARSRDWVAGPSTRPSGPSTRPARSPQPAGTTVSTQ